MASSQLAVSFECTPVREVHLRSRDEPPSHAVVTTVADLEGVDPLELPPLSQYVDPDALDRLLTGDRPAGDSTSAFCFTYCGWNVFLRGDGTLVVGDPDRLSEPTPLF